MAHKDPERKREYHSRYMREIWYPRNKEKHISFVRRNKDRVTEFIEQYKRERECVDCGFSGKYFPYVLDFDHVDSKAGKKFNIGSWSRSVLSIETIRSEMRKCELVCANCHRKRTFKNRSTK